jgi:hypothetical protein
VTPDKGQSFDPLARQISVSSKLAPMASEWIETTLGAS